jgi:hypothetical protein
MGAIDPMTDDGVQAEDEVTAIDLVLAGQGLEIDSERRHASISASEAADRDHTRDPASRSARWASHSTWVR